ncbi:MAG TPA: ABC transporter substrate-binding protein [Mycobacteriales bacterium]|jgi:peptide/nickel transport system substrate-binding protein|nr:ABC transporter substrate-binding protein [Mycobacteriales bacterium]
MRTRSRGVAVTVGIAALATVMSACGSGSSGGNNNNKGGGGGGTPDLGFQKIAVNASDGGTPVKGGTLNVLSSTDTDYLDQNVSYYSAGYAYLRPINRQMYSYSSQEGHTTDVVPDIATGSPQISSDGLTYTIKLRSGVFWNTTPKRQVVAADVVRGVKAACNPVQPFGGLPDFDFLIEGYKDYCAGFAKVGQSAKAIADYMEKTDFAGFSAPDPQTVVIKLTQPASFFTAMLAMPVFSPRPVEYDAYVPASTQLAQHTLSDGPYQVDSYQPTKKITYVRNAAWDPSTDSQRKAYVDKIIVTMTDLDPEVTLKQLQTDSPSADLAMTGVTSSDVPGLMSDPHLNLQTEVASNPYLLFNTQSPNNNGALQKVQVRQALSYALNRAHLDQVAAGPKVSPTLSHVLPPAIHGSQNFDLYPNSPTKAKQLLQQAGVKGLTLKFLFRPSSNTAKKMFQVVQQDLGAIGVKVTAFGVPDADFYTKYLQKPDSAKKGQWDLSLAGWAPDWYGDAALSFFAPLFDGRILPPTSSNFGLFNDAKVNACIDKATKEKDLNTANQDWNECDHDVMAAAAVFPILSPNRANYYPAHTHGTVYSPVWDMADMTNVWLDKNKQGG